MDIESARENFKTKKRKKMTLITGWNHEHSNDKKLFSYFPYTFRDATVRKDVSLEIG